MSESLAVATLIEDGGAGAADAEFFRSAPFLAAEGVTHTMRIETVTETLVAPLRVRPIPGSDARDASSPYGYPGLVSAERGRLLSRIATQKTTAPSLLDPARIDFTATGLVSAFVRHALGEPLLAGASERNVVQVADPALAPKSRPSDRRQVRRNLESGYELTLVPGAETTPAQRASFLAVYEQTMHRAAAAAHYFFPAAYFDRVLEADRTWLALATAPGDELAAASIAAVSDGFLHYFLSGTADSHLRAAPMKNVVTRLVELSTELALPLNLGGGLAPGDALEEFKRGFANRTIAWQTSEIICDAEKYKQLTQGRDPGHFFPAYRAP